MFKATGILNGLRWELSKFFNVLAWFVCPEPQKSHMRVMWQAKLGEFKEAAERLEAS